MFYTEGPLQTIIYRLKFINCFLQEIAFEGKVGLKVSIFLKPLKIVADGLKFFRLIIMKFIHYKIPIDIKFLHQ